MKIYKESVEKAGIMLMASDDKSVAFIGKLLFSNAPRLTSLFNTFGKMLNQ